MDEEIPETEPQETDSAENSPQDRRLNFDTGRYDDDTLETEEEEDAESASQEPVAEEVEPETEEAPAPRDTFVPTYTPRTVDETERARMNQLALDDPEEWYRQKRDQERKQERQAQAVQDHLLAAAESENPEFHAQYRSRIRMVLADLPDEERTKPDIVKRAGAYVVAQEAIASDNPAEVFQRAADLMRGNKPGKPAVAPTKPVQAVQPATPRMTPAERVPAPNVAARSASRSISRTPNSPGEALARRWGLSKSSIAAMDDELN